MTAIVAVPDVRRKRLVMGGDSAVSMTKGLVVITATPKVRRAGGYLLGAAGDGAWFSVLDALEWPTQPSRGYPGTTLLRDIYDTKRRLGLEEVDGTALLGAVINGVPRVWMFDSDPSVDEMPEESFGAVCGSGGQCAAGALYVAKGSPERRARLALEAAEAFRGDVRGPFVILKY